MTQNIVENVIILYLYAIFPYIYTRGETTSGAKRLVGAKRLGGKRLGGKTTRGGNGLGAKRPGFQKSHVREVNIFLQKNINP